MTRVPATHLETSFLSKVWDNLMKLLDPLWSSLMPQLGGLY